MGRSALLAQLDRLLIEEPADRWVVVTGGPGMGKSALLAQWLAKREAVGDPVTHHFIRRGWANWDDPEALVGSLVAQIEAQVPEMREPESEARLAPAARLAAALQRVSERALVPRSERLVLLIDGLDEYDPRPGSLAGDPLGTFLPYALPRGVSVLCASRPRHPSPAWRSRRSISHSRVSIIEHRYYPSLLRLSPSADEPWLWALLELAPTPAAGVSTAASPSW